MKNELRKRPYSRILILWIAGICLAAYIPGYILIPIITALSFLGMLLLFFSKLIQSKYPIYEQRGDWGIIFSLLFLMLSIEYTCFRFHIPAIHHSGVFFSMCEEWQFNLLSTLDALPLSDSEKSLLGAICYGYKQSISPEMRHQFSMAGAAHILAVSGFHIGVVYSFIQLTWKIPPFSYLPKRCVQTASLLIIWLFASITGLAPSAVRATFMLSLTIISHIFDRKTERFNVVWASAFWMLLYNPFYLFDLGFELSYAAVLSILFFYPRINKWLRLTELFNPVIRTVWQWFTIALTAQIGTFPLCFYFFGEISSIAILSALPVTLLSSLLIPLSLLWSILSLLKLNYPFLSSLIAGLMHVFSELVERMGQIPPIHFECPYFAWFSPISYLIIIALCIFIKKKEDKEQGLWIF